MKVPHLYVHQVLTPGVEHAKISPYLIIVNGRPEFLRKSSPIFLYFRTPNRFIMLHEKEQ